MRAHVLLSVMLLACGARTDLERGEPEEIDAYVLDTFPCRWAFATRAHEIARGASFTDLGGAVEVDQNVAVVSAMRGGESVGAFVTLAQVPREIARFDGAPGRLFTGESGFLRQEGASCALVTYALDLSPTGQDVSWEPGTCALSQSEAGRVESVSLSVRGGALSAITFDGGASAIENVADVDDAHEAAAVADGDRQYLGTVDSAGSVVLTQIGRSLTPARLDRGARLSGARDHLRGGALFLYESEMGWQLVRLHASMPGTTTVVADLGELRASPIGRIATNETEALLPLADGSMAYIALNRSVIRYTDPVPDGPVEAMEIVMRPGRSAGAALYVQRDAGDAVLRYRGLVCNR